MMSERCGTQETNYHEKVINILVIKEDEELVSNQHGIVHPQNNTQLPPFASVSYPRLDDYSMSENSHNRKQLVSATSGSRKMLCQSQSFTIDENSLDCFDDSGLCLPGISAVTPNCTDSVESASDGRGSALCQQKRNVLMRGIRKHRSFSCHTGNRNLMQMDLTAFDDASMPASRMNVGNISSARVHVSQSSQPANTTVKSSTYTFSSTETSTLISPSVSFSGRHYNSEGEGTSVEHFFNTNIPSPIINSVYDDTSTRNTGSTYFRAENPNFLSPVMMMGDVSKQIKCSMASRQNYCSTPVVVSLAGPDLSHLMANMSSSPVPSTLSGLLSEPASSSHSDTPDSGFCTPSQQSITLQSQFCSTPLSQRCPQAPKPELDQTEQSGPRGIGSSQREQTADEESPLNTSLESVQWLGNFAVSESVKPLFSTPPKTKDCASTTETSTAALPLSKAESLPTCATDTPLSARGLESIDTPQTLVKVEPMPVPSVNTSLGLSTFESLPVPCIDTPLPVIMAPKVPFMAGAVSATASSGSQKRKVLEELQINQATAALDKSHPQRFMFERPSFSYMDLIKMALKSTEDGQMALREIIAWIEDHFPYFKYEAKDSWKSSVRHNLSLHSDFMKVDVKKHGGRWKLRDDSAPCYNAEAETTPRPPPKIPQVKGTMLAAKKARFGHQPILPKGVNSYALVPIHQLQQVGCPQGSDLSQSEVAVGAQTPMQFVEKASYPEPVVQQHHPHLLSHLMQRPVSRQTPTPQPQLTHIAPKPMAVPQEVSYQQAVAASRLREVRTGRKTSSANRRVGAAEPTCPGDPAQLGRFSGKVDVQVVKDEAVRKKKIVFYLQKQPKKDRIVGKIESEAKAGASRNSVGRKDLGVKDGSVNIPRRNAASRHQFKGIDFTELIKRVPDQEGAFHGRTVPKFVQKGKKIMTKAPVMNLQSVVSKRQEDHRAAQIIGELLQDEDRGNIESSFKTVSSGSRTSLMKGLPDPGPSLIQQAWEEAGKGDDNFILVANQRNEAAEQAQTEVACSSCVLHLRTPETVVKKTNQIHVLKTSVSSTGSNVADLPLDPERGQAPAQPSSDLGTLDSVVSSASQKIFPSLSNVPVHQFPPMCLPDTTLPDQQSTAVNASDPSIGHAQPRFYRTRSRRKQVHMPLKNDESPSDIMEMNGQKHYPNMLTCSQSSKETIVESKNVSSGSDIVFTSAPSFVPNAESQNIFSLSSSFSGKMPSRVHLNFQEDSGKSQVLSLPPHDRGSGINTSSSQLNFFSSPLRPITHGKLSSADSFINTNTSDVFPASVLSQATNGSQNIQHSDQASFLHLPHQPVVKGQQSQVHSNSFKTEPCPASFINPCSEKPKNGNTASNVADLSSTHDHCFNTSLSLSLSPPGPSVFSPLSSLTPFQSSKLSSSSVRDNESILTPPAGNVTPSGSSMSNAHRHLVLTLTPPSGRVTLPSAAETPSRSGQLSTDTLNNNSAVLDISFLDNLDLLLEDFHQDAPLPPRP